MADFSPLDFDYIILPGKALSDFGEAKLYNEAYAFWEEFWAEVFLQVTGDRRRLSTDDYMRQDYVSLIRHQGTIIAMHTYSRFDLRFAATLKHSYFSKYFTPSFMTFLSEQKLSSLMTMEHFAVAKKWRGMRDIHLAKVIATLGLRLAKQLEIDAVVSAARTDVPAAKVGHDLGGKSIVKDVPVHGKPTDLVIFLPHEVIEPTDEATMQWINRFWANRRDLTMPATPKNLKRVA